MRIDGVYDILHHIEIRDQIAWLARHPVLFVAHQRDVGRQLANAGSLQQRTDARLEIGALHNVVEGADFASLQPAVTLFERQLPAFVGDFILCEQTPY